MRAISEEYSELGLPNYPTGIPFTFWEQYIWLGEHLLVAVAIVLAASFLVMAVILCNFWAAMFIVSLRSETAHILLLAQIFGFESMFFI